MRYGIAINDKVSVYIQSPISILYKCSCTWYILYTIFNMLYTIHTLRATSTYRQRLCHSKQGKLVSVHQF